MSDLDPVPPATPRDPLEGAVLGRWTIARRLGDGPMGPVYEGLSTGGTRAALHLVHAELVGTPDKLERFRRDAKTLQKIEHPSIPRLLDVDEARGQAFVAFELVEGRSLQFRLDRKEPLAPAEGRTLARDLLSALAALHEKGIVHGDVKPASVLLGREACWKLTGFSLVPREGGADPAGVIRGTPLFMSPEQCQGLAPNASSDLYSAGATIYASLAGEAPFLRPSVAAILEAHVKDLPPDLAGRVSGVDRDVLQLIGLLMAKNPGKRPPDAKVALAVLGAVRPRAKTQPFVRATVLETARAEAKASAATTTPAGATPRATIGTPANATPRAAVTPTRAIPRAGLVAPTPAAPAAPPATPQAPAPVASPQPTAPPEATPSAPAAAQKATGPAAFTKSSQRKALDYVHEEEGKVAKDPGKIPWLRLILPLAVAGALGAASFSPEATAAVGALGRVAFLAGAVAFALFGVALVLAGMEPAGLSHGATARTILARAPLRFSAWWNRRRGNLARTAQALGKLGEFATAGELFLDAGEPVLAAEEFLKAEIPLAAAIIFEKIGAPARALDAYVAAGKLDEATNLAGGTGLFEAAGEAFERAGHLDRAAQAFASAQKPLRLAEVLERQGKLHEAAQQYERAGELVKSAELYERAGQIPDAARAFERAGDLARVAAVWEAAGNAANAARWRAEKELAEGRRLNAARAFEAAGMHGRAADLFVAENLLPDAIRCADAAGDPVRSAQLYARAKDWKKAAALYEQAGRFREAANGYGELGDAVAQARALERASEPLAAADSWIRADKPDEARRVLEAVPVKATERKRARARLGTLEAKAGRPREAARALVEALEGEAPTPENATTFVECADALAACGELDQALATLERIKALPFAPPTVRMRLADLEAKKRSLATGVGPEAGRGGKDLVGFELDRYKTLSYVGEGELAWAYEAEHVLLKRTAALRVLKPSVDRTVAKRFFDEGRALALSRHPNLPDVYDAGRTPSGLSYVALDLAKEPTLRQVLRDARGSLKVSRAATIGAGMLAGLVAAHEAGVVHGDLRPENVLVAPGDQARVVGFAFARHVPTITSATRKLTGMRSYSAPEQLSGAAPGPAADQYACGVILYEMLSGVHPFAQVDAAAEAPEAAPLGEVEPNVPDELSAAVMKALAKEPERRHASLSELRRIVAEFAPA